MKALQLNMELIEAEPVTETQIALAHIRGRKDRDAGKQIGDRRLLADSLTFERS
jgi:hypothetical protein